MELSLQSGLICAALAGGILLVLHAFRHRKQDSQPNSYDSVELLAEPQPACPETVLEYISAHTLIQGKEVPKELEMLLAQLPVAANRMIIRHELPAHLWPQVIEFVEQTRIDLLSNRVKQERAIPKVDEFIRRKRNEYLDLRPRVQKL